MTLMIKLVIVKPSQKHTAASRLHIKKVGVQNSNSGYLVH